MITCFSHTSFYRIYIILLPVSVWISSDKKRSLLNDLNSLTDSVATYSIRSYFYKNATFTVNLWFKVTYNVAIYSGSNQSDFFVSFKCIIWSISLSDFYFKGV